MRWVRCEQSIHTKRYICENDFKKMKRCTRQKHQTKCPWGPGRSFTCFNLEELDKIQKIIKTRTGNTLARNERIRTRFNELYNTERKRLDDVIEILATEFCIAKRTVESALKT